MKRRVVFCPGYCFSFSINKIIPSQETAKHTGAVAVVVSTVLRTLVCSLWNEVRWRQHSAEIATWGSTEIAQYRSIKKTKQPRFQSGYGQHRKGPSHMSALQTIQTPELHTRRLAIRRKIRGTIPSARTTRPQSTQKKFDRDLQGIGLSEAPGISVRCLCQRWRRKQREFLNETP